MQDVCPCAVARKWPPKQYPRWIPVAAPWAGSDWATAAITASPASSTRAATLYMASRCC